MSNNFTKFFFTLACFACCASLDADVIQFHYISAGCGDTCQVACPPFCAACTSTLLCTSCLDGYGLFPQSAYDSTMRVCVVCPANYYLDSDTAHCEYCSTGCAICTDSTSCTACLSGYYLYEDACSTSCDDGYFESEAYCVPCPDSCAKCTSGSICTECDSGYGLRNDQCISCPTGTYLASGSCVVCPSNCATCTSSTSCQSCTNGAYLYTSKCPTTCPDGYFSSGTFCMSCPSSCATCTSSSSCETCSSGWGLLNGACDNCPDGYYLSGTTCEACPSECATCSTSSTCLSCNSGYSLDGSNCVSCPQKKFAFSGICVDCPATCAECTDASTCQSCVDGYGLYGGQCADCPSSTSYSNGQCIVNNQTTSQTVTSSTTHVTTVTTSASSVVSIGSSNPLTFGLISKTIEKIRFLQIGYSEELEDVFLSWNVDLYSIQIPDKLADKLVAEDTPEIFSIYGIDSTFLMNYWGDMMIIGICLVCIAFLKILDIIFPKTKKGSLVFVWILRAKLMVQNYLIVQIYGGFGDIAFYFVLEMKTLKFGGSVASIVSFVIAIIFIMLGILLLSLQIWILLSYQKNKRESEEALQKFCVKFSALGVLFLDFKDTSTLSQAFMTVLILRDILMSLVSIAMTNSPYGQAILFFSCSVLMWLYLIFKNPFEGYFDRIIQYLMEAIILTVNIIVLILAYMDKKSLVETDLRKRLGKVIIVSNFVLNIVAIFCLAIQLLQISYAIYKVLKLVIVHYKKKKMGASGEKLAQNLENNINEALEHMPRGLRIRRRVLRNPIQSSSGELLTMGGNSHHYQKQKRNDLKRNQKKTLMYLYKHNTEFKKAMEDIRFGGKWR